MKKLSNKLSVAILQALDDLELCMNDENYIIDFNQYHHPVEPIRQQFNNVPYQKCAVCFAGYNYQKEKIKKYLEFGKEYTVDYTDVDSSSTDVYLQEFPDLSFNSVFFEDVVEQPYELNKQHPHYYIYNRI